MTATHPIRVLLIDDDRADYVITRDVIESIPGAPYTLEWESDYESGLAAVRRRGWDVVLLDYKLGARLGVELLRAARADGIDTPIVMLTAVEAQAADKEALDAGADDYLTKANLNGALLDRAIRYTLDQWAHRRETQQSLDDVQAILDQLRSGTAITEADGVTLSFVSGAFERIVGLARGDLLHRPWFEALPLDAAAQDDVSAVMAAPGADRTKIPVEWRRGDGTHCWCELEVVDDPRDGNRKILVLYDVTDLHGLRRMLDRKTSFHDLLGKSQRMREVFEQLQELAKFDTTVLIEGDTGTGKELAARAIHQGGCRSGKPFIAVNCAGLSDSLLASQLFGHKKGAFTGAVSEHVGFLEAAHGGTLFLDEIGDVPQPVQTSLLRVLQEREIVRVGETRPRPIDVQLISATNRDLAAMVETGEFRADLLYRIRVARVAMPPLRERVDDIPLLASTFLQRFVARTGKEIEGVSQDALSALVRYDWPGNVRELENAIEAAAIQCRSFSLRAEDLPPEIQSRPQGLEASERSGASGQGKEGAIQDALTRAGGNRAKAARLLGISRATLYRRLNELTESGELPPSE